MKITKKIIQVGSSLGVLLNKQILERLDLKKGDFVEIDIKLVRE